MAKLSKSQISKKMAFKQKHQQNIKQAKHLTKLKQQAGRGGKWITMRGRHVFVSN